MKLSIKNLYILLFLIVATQDSCRADKNNSIVELEYLGFSDTVVAILHGKVLNLYNKPIQNATIKTFDNKHETQTDSLGRFELGFEEGVFDVIVQVPKYQKVLLKSYLSHPDQVTRTTIQLSEKRFDTLVYNASPKQNGLQLRKK